MTSKSTDRKAPPISAHRYFPAIVALWFAALFGLGSLVLPAALPEMIVTSLGLDALMPALAPPHGYTARILIALAATVIGGTAGLFLSRKIAAMQAPRPVRSRVPGAAQASAPSLRQSDQHPDAPARRPISALEELGEDRLVDAVEGQVGQDQLAQAEDTGLPAAPVSGRRRALIVSREDGPSDWSQHAPVPGVPEFPPVEGHESSKTAKFAAPNALHVPNVPNVLNLDDSAGDEPVYSAPLELDIEADIAANSEPDQPMQAPRFDTPPAPAPFAQPISVDAPVLAVSEPSEPDDLPVADSIHAAAPVVQRPLAELGMAELVERLAYAMQHCDTPIGDASGAGSATPENALYSNAPMPEPVEPAQGRAATTPEPEIPVIPAALRPIELTIGADDGADNNDDEMPGFALARHPVAPIPADALLANMTQDDGFLAETSIDEIQPDAAPPIFGNDGDDGDGDGDESDDEAEGQVGATEDSDYSSLLNLKTGLSQPTEFVRIDEPAPEAGSLEPVVIFPGQEMRRTLVPEMPQASEATDADMLEEDAGTDVGTGAGASMAESPTLPSDPFSAPSVSRPFDSPQSGAVRPDFGKPAEGAEADPAETERALRAALATLQRMSGAA